MNDVSERNKAQEVDIAQMASNIVEAIRSFKKMNHLRLMVVGKTGVGKSTLINSMFRENLAETGIGKPITDEIKEITKRDSPISIIDTVGFETDPEKQKTNKHKILQVIKKGKEERDYEVHAILYCISAEGRRIEDKEIQWLKEFSQDNELYKTPVIVVLTNVTRKEEGDRLREIILQENLNILQVVPVLAQDVDFNGEYKAKAHGLDKLCKVIEEALPKAVQDTFITNQKASLELKKKYANRFILATLGVVSVEGYVPVPFADALTMVPTQVTMLASITKIYGLDISTSILVWFISSLAGSAGAATAGKFIVANLLKLIPGAGSAAGGTLSAVTAAILTLALGKTYIELMESLYIGEIAQENIDEPENREKFERIFREKLKDKDLRKEAEKAAKDSSKID